MTPSVKKPNNMAELPGRERLGDLRPIGSCELITPTLYWLSSRCTSGFTAEWKRCPYYCALPSGRPHRSNKCLYDIKAAFGRAGCARLASLAVLAGQPQRRAELAPAPASRPVRRAAAHTSTAGIEGGGVARRATRSGRGRRGSFGRSERQLRAWFGPRVRGRIGGGGHRQRGQRPSRGLAGRIARRRARQRRVVFGLTRPARRRGTRPFRNASFEQPGHLTASVPSPCPLPNRSRPGARNPRR